MTYFRSLFFNFLAVFLVNRLAPGVEIGLYQNVPNIGAALLFSLIVGFFNASVFPALFIFELNPTIAKIAVITGVISFTSFLLIAIFPFGVQVEGPFGVFFAGSAVWGVAFLTNYFEWHRGAKKNK